jgi:asparagine synthase (glutamine-hydrolysing)
MSGFAGVVSLDGAPADAQLLQRMAGRLAFRGPDGRHITTKPGAGFCFTFLRTGPAPQCPSQPCSLDGRVWLLGDVRLDGRDDLRRKLEQHGDKFEADVTDEELVLRVWRRWGEEGLPDLLGDYAFALWDVESRKLWCARDLMGARPFFYAQAGNHLYFSNTLDAIRCAPDISSALDHHFIGDFLLEEFCLDPARTAFRDISRLAPGHALRYSKERSDVCRYTSLPTDEPLWLKRDEEYVERFRELLEQAVLERLPRGPTAIFMSGGLDSTSVAAVAANCAERTGIPVALRAYTVDCRPVFDDREGQLASLAAQHLGIPIKVLSVNGTLPFAGWDDCRLSTPEPYHDPFRPLYLQQVRLAAQNARVVLNGYGGDGPMTGQSWPYLVYLTRRLRFGVLVGAFGGYMLRHGRIPPLRAGFRSALHQWLGGSDPLARYPRWLIPQFENELNLRERRRRLPRSREPRHPWYPLVYEALNRSSWAGVLESGDAAWHGVPLESRSPLLDLRIQRFLLRVPPVPLCVNKELLRRAVDGLLPEEIRLRPKTPLQCDPLGLQIESGRWSPLPLPEPNEGLRAIVDWQELGSALRIASSSAVWRDLRPISLLYWLRCIEKNHSIE